MKIKTIKQNLSLLLSCVLILTNVANTYALSSIRADKNINITARETSQANVVYLKNGEGRTIPVRHSGPVTKLDLPAGHIKIYVQL